MKSNVDDDTREIIESFIAEGHERLDDAEVKLEKLGQGDDREILNAVFRLFHSVKGSAGFLDFNQIKSLTHEAEALLEVFIKEGIPYTQDALDVVYGTIDVLRNLIVFVERDYHDEAGKEQVPAQVERIKACTEKLRASKPGRLDTVPKPAGCIPGEKRTPVEVNETSMPVPIAPQPECANTIPLNELVTRDMAERFIAESADLLEKVERDILELENQGDKTESVHSMFRAVHTIKGNAGFFGYAALEQHCMDLEHFLDGARKGEQSLNESFANTVLSRVDVIRALLSTVTFDLPGNSEKNDFSVACASSALDGGHQGQPNSYQPIGEILVNMGVTDESAVRKVLELQEKPVGQLLVEAGAAKPEDVQKALDLQRSMGGEQAPVEDIKRKEIRVDTTKLDKLFDLVGELITAESIVINSPELIGLKLDSFGKSFSALAKISREIQETAMMIRMIPLDGTFHKMSRLVRDLSRKFDKPVDFLISGEDTEMDKNVIEHISDPLVHIIRNAVDHGLEVKSERLAAGKKETGTISLDARYEGSEIWVSIKDDGGGLNKEGILAKAIERGLVKSSDAATLDDKSIYDFIFEPGFSTSKIVSDVSGRGVGMDVVKKNLEKIRGRVDVHTEGGKGTEFVLKIPLTLAIIDGITVRVGPNYYSLPLNDILEFFKARNEQINRTEEGQETVNLRGMIMPMLKLAQIFNVPNGCTSATEGIILVVRSNGQQACLLIDEVVGNQQIVIKSLSEYIGKVEGLSGCSILGDGTVSFIIDTGHLMGLCLE